MTVYVNRFSLMLPCDVLIALGKPEYIKLRWIISEKRLLFYAVESDTAETDAAYLVEKYSENVYTIPSLLYDCDLPLVLPKSEFPDKLRRELRWNDDEYAIECRAVVDNTGRRCILCDLKTARLTDRLA